MPVALLCSRAPLERELAGTLLWSEAIERRYARTPEEVRRITRQVKPDIAIVDGTLPEARDVVSDLRRFPRHLSIVVLGRGRLAASEVELMAAGANAVLSAPAGPEWDERLRRLTTVPPRKDARLPLYFERGEDMGTRVGLGTILNVSAHGALLETAADIHLGDILDLRFRLPDPLGGVTGCGRVVRLAAAGRYGVEFLGLKGTGTEAVDRFVADYRSEVAPRVRLS